MDAISIIAWIVIVFSVVKTLFVIFSPKSWMKFAMSLWKTPAVGTAIFTILGAIILYYLIGSGLTVVQIFAVFAFTICIFAISLSAYMKELLPAFQKVVISKNLISRAWLIFLIWLALVIWAIIELI